MDFFYRRDGHEGGYALEPTRGRFSVIVDVSFVRRCHAELRARLGSRLKDVESEIERCFSKVYKSERWIYEDDNKPDTKTSGDSV